MPPIRCEVLRRDGPEPLPCVVRTDDGRTLHLYGDDAPPTARWLGTLAGTPVWAVRVEETPDAAAVADEVLVVDTEAIDEVGVAVGPDRDEGLGLFDVVRTENSLTGEPTGVAAVQARPEQRRTQILAWIAAQPAARVDPAAVAEPCEPLKRLVADEALDPLPALDGGPRRPLVTVPPPPAEPRPPAEVTATALVTGEVTGTPPGPEREDTATQIEVSGTVTAPAPRTSRAVLFGVAVGAGAIALVLWRALG